MTAIRPDRNVEDSNQEDAHLTADLYLCASVIIVDILTKEDLICLFNNTSYRFDLYSKCNRLYQNNMKFVENAKKIC